MAREKMFKNLGMQAQLVTFFKEQYKAVEIEEKNSDRYVLLKIVGFIKKEEVTRFIFIGKKGSIRINETKAHTTSINVEPIYGPRFKVWKDKKLNELTEGSKK